MQMIRTHLRILSQLGQKLGPYLMLEILLPGGTLLALLLFLYQRRKLAPARWMSVENIRSMSNSRMTKRL